MRGKPENTLHQRRGAVVRGGGGRFSICCRNQKRKRERGGEFVGVEGIRFRLGIFVLSLMLFKLL